ncbi:MAG: hypothetical protein KC441_19770 [Anaerolineales bacterium]|nr:hypothetical protein [Anaerolineales bacterium]
MGTKSDEYQVTRQDVADILAGTLQLLTEHGLAVGVRSAAAKPERAAGLLIYVSGVTLAADGNLAALEE